MNYSGNKKDVAVEVFLDNRVEMLGDLPQNQIIFSIIMIQELAPELFT